MAKEKKTEPEAPVVTAPPTRKRLFETFAKVHEVTGSSDLENLQLEEGDNRIRILGEPVLIRKHWDLPESSELTVVPCAKFIEDYGAYCEDPAGYLESLPECPYCDLAEVHPGFYKVKDSWVFNVEQRDESASDKTRKRLTDELGRAPSFAELIAEEVKKGVCVPKVAEFHQVTILKAIAKFEENPLWLEFMPNGISDMEIVITKEVPKKGPTKYAVGGVPTSKPLPADVYESLLSKAMDIRALKMPPDASTDEGMAKWKELLSKANAPAKGESPKEATKGGGKK